VALLTAVTEDPEWRLSTLAEIAKPAAAKL
jgi:hypothetical protein